MFEIIALLIAAYGGLILFLWFSDEGNGKRKDFSGWLLFGLMWPKIKEQIGIDVKQSGNVFIVILSMFMIVAIGIAYFFTHGKFSFM